MQKKRIIRMLTTLLVSSMILTSTAFATYSNGPSNSFYNRTNAAQYVYDYTGSFNPNYTNYTNYGGDCTNFVSQVLAAGGMPMTQSVSNPTTNDWYYYGPNWGTQRTATWTDAHQFRYYWADVNGVGSIKANAFLKLKAGEFDTYSKWMQLYRYLEPGDIIQYVRPSDWKTYHSQAIEPHTKTENSK